MRIYMQYPFLCELELSPALLRRMQLGMSTKGRKIREVRKRLGLTQVEFAERLETTQGTISRWEAGDQAPELNFLMKIGALGGFDPIQFALWDEEHQFRESIFGNQATVVGGIQWDYWTETISWDPADQFNVQIPIASQWADLRIAGFVVQDESADKLYPKGSIVFAVTVPGAVWPPSPHEVDALYPGRDLLAPRHGDLVIVKRERGDHLVELTIRQFYAEAAGESYLTSVANNPRFSSWEPQNPGPRARKKATEIIGIIVASFRLEATEARFKQPDK